MAKLKKNTVKDYIQTVGRRKSAVARVRLYPTLRKVMEGEIELSKGEASVNGALLKDYFGFKSYYPKFNKFLKHMGVEGKFIMTVKVAGGGESGQLDAMIHGVARALDKQDTDAYHDKRLYLVYPKPLLLHESWRPAVRFLLRLRLLQS